MKILLLNNRAKNIVAKEEIAHYEHFLQCFEKSAAVDTSNCVCYWGRYNLRITFYEQTAWIDIAHIKS